MNKLILLYFLPGLAVGFATARREAKSGADLHFLALAIMSIYITIRDSGNFDQRLNRILALTIGITVGFYGYQAIIPTAESTATQAKPAHSP